MNLIEYVPILIQLSIAVGMGVIILVASHIFGQKGRHSKIKDQAYECGMVAEGSANAKFSVKFYVVAMLFILFDVEVVFLIPWVTIYRDFLQAGIPIVMPIVFFLVVLVMGLAYELKKGALDWEK